MNDESVQQLLVSVEQRLPRLADPANLTALEMGVMVKECLDHLRSCLDYIAMDIVQCLNLQIDERVKVYFPVHDTEEKYEKHVKESFPSLEVKSPVISRQLRSVQSFTSHESVLGKLRMLSNSAKHHALPKPIDRKTARVEVPGAFLVEGRNIVFSGNRINGMLVDEVGIREGDVVFRNDGLIPALVVKNHRLFLEHINEDAAEFLGRCVAQIRPMALAIYSELETGSPPHPR